MRFSHQMAALVILATLVALIYGAYTELNNNYGEITDYTVDNETVMEALNNLNLVGSINETASSLHAIAAPGSGLTDIIGGLASAGIGAIKTVGGLFTLPIEVLVIINDFYPVPGAILTGLATLVVVYVGFMLVGLYLGRDP